ncbi:MAG TPA: hypothetical protein VHZ06_02025 [Marmoricola sp.]|nr:hypothetical protein [Marmoricola sp.]
MSTEEQPVEPREVTDSDPNAGEADGLAGEMGVSSERVGAVRGDADGTHGAEDTSATDSPADAPPEQSADPATGPEVHPANDLPPHQADLSRNPGHAGR